MGFEHGSSDVGSDRFANSATKPKLTLKIGELGQFTQLANLTYLNRRAVLQNHSSYDPKCLILNNREIKQFKSSKLWKVKSNGQKQYYTLNSAEKKFWVSSVCLNCI